MLWKIIDSFRSVNLSIWLRFCLLVSYFTYLLF